MCDKRSVMYKVDVPAYAKTIYPSRWAPIILSGSRCVYNNTTPDVTETVPSAWVIHLFVRCSVSRDKYLKAKGLVQCTRVSTNKQTLTRVMINKQRVI